MTDISGAAAAPLPPHAPPPAPPGPTTFSGAPGSAAPRARHAVRFTGSGSEYFRIWIVNLMLTIVTIGFYYPFAKVRRLRYVYANIDVGGHALAFHANPWTMFRGHVLVGALFVLYSIAGRFSITAGFIAFLVVAAVWPALLKSSLQFRLANTRWRGLPLRFTGSLGAAYTAVLPFLLPLVVLGAVGAGARGDAPGDPQPPVLGIVAFVAMAVGGLMLPWLWWRLKRYQHDHFAYGDVRTGLQCGARPFYGVALKALGFFVVIGAAVGVVGFLVARGVLGHADLVKNRELVIGIGVLAPLLIVFVVQLLLRPYVTARMQNLVWSATGGSALQFTSHLSARSLALLSLKNWLLTLVTIGFYWPFAVIATTRLRLEAMSLAWQVDPESLVGDGPARAGEAAGDAAGDLFGFDIGL